MKYQKQRTLLLLLAIAGLCFSSYAQTMQLDDLLKLYHADSNTVRQYCADKKFNLQQVKNDGAATKYKFEAGNNSKTILEIIYPNDTTGNIVRLNYWFDDKKDYGNFIAAFKKEGFTKETISQPQTTPAAHAERYINKDMQVEFIQASSDAPYWLFLHRAGQYNW